LDNNDNDNPYLVIINH